MSTSVNSPCSKGHTQGRRKNGVCIGCEKERYSDPARAAYVKSKQAERRAAIKADPVLLAKQQRYAREYKEKNREKLNAQSSERYHRSPEGKIKYRLKRLGIEPTPDLVEYILNHDGKCTICGREPDGKWKELALDHCHKTGVFRGVLYNRCNKAIGLFENNAEAMEVAAAYVRHYQQQKE